MSTIVVASDVNIDLNDPATNLLSKASGAPIMIHSRLRDDWLCEATSAHGIHALLFEGGKATQFNEDVESLSEERRPPHLRLPRRHPAGSLRASLLARNLPHPLGERPPGWHRATRDQPR
jgi:hypothetical protein